jgi:hypothetical protein
MSTLKLFSAGLLANLLYVISGVAKQYLIATQLSVDDFGIYGAWVTQASILLVALPFPAYLNVLIKGFSASPDDQAMRQSLMADVKREQIFLGLLVTLILIVMLTYAIWTDQLLRMPIALLLLLVAQYLGVTSDITLRMFESHQWLAAFMAVRNLPSIALIVLLGLRSPLTIAIVEVTSALFVGWLVYRSKPLRNDGNGSNSRRRPTLQREQATLWMARLIQYMNSSLLRFVIPLSFQPHEIGVFFFACIAQIPCSLFLSVANQLFGPTLARLNPGDYRTFVRVQTWFIVPNLMYVITVALVVPHWSSLTVYVSSLSKYRDAGIMIFMVALYSAVLTSDCQEFLLRGRGMSKFLLQYSACSIVTQIGCLAVASYMEFSLSYTIALCAGMALTILSVSTGLSFRRVVYLPNQMTHQRQMG